LPVAHRQCGDRGSQSPLLWWVTNLDRLWCRHGSIRLYEEQDELWFATAEKRVAKQSQAMGWLVLSVNGEREVGWAGLWEAGGESAEELRC